MKNISQQIREMRRNTGLSLQRAARRIDTSPATLSRYENGWKRFEVYTLNKIAAALGYRMKITFERIPRAGKPAGLSATIRQLERLFWDRPLKAEHFRQYPAWVTERVLDYGTLRDVQVLIQFLGREKFFEIVLEIHFKSTRTRTFWQHILGKENQPCIQKPFRQEVVKSWPN